MVKEKKVVDVVNYFLDDDSKTVLYVNVNTKELDVLEGTFSMVLTKSDDEWNKAIEYFGECMAYDTQIAGYVVEITLKNIVEITDMGLLNIGYYAFQRHKFFNDGNWQDGEPVRIWKEDDYEVCVKYESGKEWHYRDLELPFPTFE